MNRHQIRKEVFKAVFMNEFHDTQELSDIHDLFLQGRDSADEEDLIKNNKSEEDEEYIKKKVEDISLKIEEIDGLINERVEGWKTNRMSKVDLTLLRLAYYEIVYEKIPKGAAINEAVSLADEFGTDASASFVNGALVKILKDE